MRSVSSTYKTLRAAVGSRYEVKIVQDETVYGMDKIMRAVVHQSLLSSATGPAIGGTASSYCDIRLAEETGNWPRMAEFEIFVRLVSADGETTSEWLSFGTYWTDTRNQNGPYLDITAYDSMLQLNQYWTGKIPSADLPESWPITAAAAAALLEETTGIELDSRDILDDTVAFVGLDTMATARETWRDIAAAEGCNAVITPEGKIHLVPLANGGDPDTAVAGIAITGFAVAGTGQSSAPGDPDSIYLGMAMRKLKTGQDLTAVTGVELSDAAGYLASAGTSTGYVIKARCNYSNSAAALLSLAGVDGYVYRPFEAQGAELDPAAEVGDLVIIDGVSYQIMNVDWDLGSWITADLSAPEETSIDHEYSVLSESAVTLRKALENDAALNTALRSYIQQTATEITSGIAAQYVSDAYLEDMLAKLQMTIAGAIQMYTGTDIPTLLNLPASAWTTTEERTEHVGDLYRIVNSGAANDGDYYQFILENSTFSWTKLNDSEVEGALSRMAIANQAAADAQLVSDQINLTLTNEYSPTADIESRFYLKDEAEIQRDLMQSEISLTNNRLTVAMSNLETSVDGQFSSMAYYIRYQNGVVIIGRTDEPSTFQISPTQVSACYGNEVISFWNQDKQRTPRQLEIPLGGSLRLGDMLWQPRSSGNLSLLWVGQDEEEEEEEEEES